MILEALVSLRVKHQGQELQWPQGHRLEWSETEAHKLLTRVPDKVRRVDGGPQVPYHQTENLPHPTTMTPLQPGWQVVWRDRNGVLKDGIVQRVEPQGSVFRVHLENGKFITSNLIRSVGRIEHGKKVAAWLTHPHGLGGPAPDSWERVWEIVLKEMAALLNDSAATDEQIHEGFDLLKACEQAFERGDYLSFHDHLRNLQALRKDSGPPMKQKHLNNNWSTSGSES